jgi:hypothetical protein
VELNVYDEQFWATSVRWDTSTPVLELGFDYSLPSSSLAMAIRRAASFLLNCGKLEALLRTVIKPELDNQKPILFS